MVTLAERISESEPRRSRRLPGSLRVPAVQDATAVKSLHRDHLSRFYPQGSTAIPACEIEYPGVAAQPRPPASAKFRPADATSGLGLSPSELNINGANTYQFVMSNPVGAVDPWGIAWQGSANAAYYAQWHSNPYLSGPPGQYVGATPDGYSQYAPPNLPSQPPEPSPPPSGPNFGDLVLAKLKKLGPSPSVSYVDKNTLLELPPPFGMVASIVEATGETVRCRYLNGAAGVMFIGKVGAGVGWGEGFVEQDMLTAPPSHTERRVSVDQCRICRNNLKFELQVTASANVGVEAFGFALGINDFLKNGAHEFPSGPWRWELSNQFGFQEGGLGGGVAADLMVSGVGEAKGTLSWAII